MIRKTMVLFGVVLLAQNAVFGQSGLVAAYRSGKIVLSPDPHFGRGVDWAAVVLNFANDMTVSPDGSIFVANNREHVILKFDGDGRLVKRFGRKGQGPGDFESPANLGILDNRILVVGEYPGNRRISLFDLEGRFLKLIRTEAAVFDIAPLRGDSVAYSSWSFARKKPSGGIDHHRVYIKDTGSGRETLVAEAKIPYRSFGAYRLDPCGNLLVAATHDHELLIADTRQAKVQVVDPSGKELRTILLRLKPFPLTRDYLRRYKSRIIQDLKNSPAASFPGIQDIIRDIEGASWDSFVDDHFPLFKNIIVDEEGNLLVFKNTGSLSDGPIPVQVYSPTGEYIVEFELDPGPFEIEVDHRFKNLCFTGRGIFGMFPRRDDPDEIIVLTKTSLFR